MMRISIRAQGGSASVCYRLKEPESREYAKRGNVDIFTDGSRRRMLKFLRSSDAGYRSIGTLTYPSEFDASSFRAHWRAFASRWRRLFAGDVSASIFWFLEFQQNGQPHFHFFCNRYIEKGWLSVAWYDITKTGCVLHAKAGTNIQGLRGAKSSYIAYAAKYAAKNNQKTLPDMYKDSGAGRWWGIVGNRDIVSAAIMVDDTEVGFFGLDSILDMIHRGRGRVIFDDFGALVVVFPEELDFWDLFRKINSADKVLQQAESKYRAEIYRKRRG
jgi:hypothetical protein